MTNLQQQTNKGIHEIKILKKLNSKHAMFTVCYSKMLYRFLEYTAN